MPNHFRPMTELEALEDEAMHTIRSRTEGNAPYDPHMVNWAPFRRIMQKEVKKLGIPRREALLNIIGPINADNAEGIALRYVQSLNFPHAQVMIEDFKHGSDIFDFQTWGIISMSTWQELLDEQIAAWVESFNGPVPTDPKYFQ